MSKDLKAIQKELEKATGVSMGKDDSEQDYLKRLIRKVAALDDGEWKDLSSDAQDWYNANAEVMNDKKDIPGFGESEAAPARRRAAADDDEPADPKVGDSVTVVQMDGEKVVGEVIEIDDKYITVDTGDGEEEAIKRKLVKSIKVKASKSKDDEPKEPADPKVGDVVEVTETDGEVTKGEITELDDKYITLDVKGEEVNIKRKAVKSISMTKAPDRRAAKDDDDKPRRRSSKDDDEKPARTRAGAAKGEESDVTKAWKLIAENLDADFAKVQKLVAKAGLDVKENTLNIKFNDVHRHHELFKGLKLIKD